MSVFKIKIENMTERKNQTGATMLIIIISMVVLAVIGIAIYSMTFTATLNQVIAQRAAKAFYISESGIRIAASEYKNAAAANKITTLLNLHDKTFTLSDAISSFGLEIYPYWFYAYATIVPGTNPIDLYLPGGVPMQDETSTTVITIPANCFLFNISTLTSLTVSSTPPSVGAFDAAAGGTRVRFTLSQSLANQINSGAEFYFGFSYGASQQGVNMVLNDPNDTGQMFPPKNGTIIVEQNSGARYSCLYESRVIDQTSTPHTVTLTNITNTADANTPLCFSDVGNITRVYIGNVLGVRSTATYGN
jgi:hypothetical protein